MNKDDFDGLERRIAKLEVDMEFITTWGTVFAVAWIAWAIWQAI